ncbi:hypothetical protein [Candidatus Bathycorpusculum sp.]|jgi:hypothetical protein|uniref:hypothetical protein n=1 Tax=Candidatus Bathycorpusculum sp. TaxID=2994959 RepID=UPI002832D2CE|nr:hypothetical protein [Candidatus Termitimicrobium sp.]MCL2685414.1 hypothetical protein [Candidatus Termitimicrobium sp.]
MLFDPAAFTGTPHPPHPTTGKFKNIIPTKEQSNKDPISQNDTTHHTTNPTTQQTTHKHPKTPKNPSDFTTIL